MANLSITRRCRRHCEYCFAKHELARDSVEHMPPDVYERALRFLERSGFPEARILGGEPTEHPLFRDYVALARERGFRVVVFSGGLVRPSALEFMASLPAEDFLLVLNAADPARDAKGLVSRQRDLCRTLGARVMLGVNIQSPQQDATHVFEWVREYGLLPSIRIGMAHPIWGGVNDCFRLRSPQVFPVFEKLVALGAAMRMDVGFDCGFTPCMFSRGFVDAHPELFARNNTGQERSIGDGVPFGTDSEQLRASQDAVGVRCNPVVDVMPEGDCIACYALSRFDRFPLPDGGTCNDVASSFERKLVPVLPAGIYRGCLHCGYRTQGMCGGGCRARRAQRLRPSADNLLQPASELEALDE